MAGSYQRAYSFVKGRMTDNYELTFHHVTVDGEGLKLPETAVWRDLAYDGQSVLVAIERSGE